MSTLTDLSPILIPLVALLIPIVGIIASTVLKVTRLHLLHETVRSLSASGQAIPPELLSEIVGKKS
ncbi:hypothetical protein H3H37_02350 [Duganella sp. LX20W]|uniref:Uncharacterized protein n=1 Tax=Rugamonas brunnea TaxID=2758569 RepID=A0A7W2ENV5_9BURK|nr:hypothetical protein [Rugamonas brunnea]MBA5635890.1 hypothetical protein [Rugamonas brunnea]